MLLNGFFQNGYVVRNIDAAIARLQERHGLPEIHAFESEVIGRTMEGVGPVHIKVALLWIGKLQIELIQPLSGHVRLYSEILDGGDAIRLHHIGLRVTDWDATLAAIDRSKAPIAYEGEFGGVKWVYADTRDTLGHYLEYIWATPEGARLLGWPDDCDPVR